MKIIPAILLLMGLVYSNCITIESDLLINTTLTLSAGSCYYVSDLNATLNGTEQTNNVVNLTAPSSISDSFSGNTYNCLRKQENLNQTLEYGASYSNTQINLTITSKPQPKIDKIVNLTCGETYQNNDYNLSVQTKIPKYNINKTLDCGLTYVHQESNITVSAKNLGKLDTSKTLNCGETYTLSELNYTVKAPKCIDGEYYLNFGSKYDNKQYNLTVHAPKKIGENLTLRNQERYSNKEADFSVTCEVNDTVFQNYCKNIDEKISKNWDFVNTKNHTCGIVSYQCMDNLTTKCSLKEKLDYPFGVINCVNRIVNETQKTCNTTKNDLSVCQIERNKLTQSEQTTSDNVEGLQNILEWIAAGVFALVGGIAFVYFWVEKKKKEDAEL